MSDEDRIAPDEVGPDRIDVDLSNVDQPFLTVEDGTYRITLKDCKLKRSKTDRPMLECFWVTQHPELGEEVLIRDYPLLDQQSGKFKLRQIIHMRGLDERTWTVGQLVGATGPAELEVEESEEYGKQNRIRRILQDVPKAVARR